MRELTADTVIRLKAPLPLPQKAARPPLTGDTKIRLSQIVEESVWTKDKHSKYRPGDKAVWKNGIYEKTHHGWRKVSGKDNTAQYGIKLNKNNLEQNRRKLVKVIVSKAKPNAIKGTTTPELRKNTRQWIKNNIHEPVNTEIGKVTFKETCADKIYFHGNNKTFREKADLVPCIKDVLQKGVYIGEAPDFDGEDINNHYFAGKVNTPRGRKILFCRVRDCAGDKERPRFYFHDILTIDDIIKQGAIPNRGTSTNQNPSGSSLFKSLIYNFLYVK